MSSAELELSFRSTGALTQQNYVGPILFAFRICLLLFNFLTYKEKQALQLHR
jgi:hypothetical protein